MTKNKNEGFLAHAKKRTSDAALAINLVIARVRKKFDDGDRSLFDDEGILTLKHADISMMAGKGGNLLNGRMHKHTTKIIVETFLDQLQEDYNKLRIVKSGPSIERQDDWKQKYEELSERFERLGSHSHRWWIRLRVALAENRQLKSSARPKVVSIDKDLRPRP